MRNPVHPQTWASLSVSECESAEALGLDTVAFNNLIYRFSEFLLNRGFRMIFGHDWRADGVMEIVAKLAETRTSNFQEKLEDGLPRMLNIVPQAAEGLSECSVRAMEGGRGLLEVVSLYSLWSDNSNKVSPRFRNLLGRGELEETTSPTMLTDPVSRNWALRLALTEIGQPGIRVCLGGKTQGYSGAYAGIAEEAFFACKANLPLYLVAGFGGTTAEVAACFSNHPEQLFRSRNSPASLKFDAGRKKPENTTLAKKLKMPLDDLIPWFKNYSIKMLSKNNGLSPKDNEKLFKTTDVEVVLHLLEKGFGSLEDSGKLRTIVTVR
ncbi:MAG: hypothetical protein GKR95_15550 [Gammaproteobacteria bacterium]|nr:hypothetical protein [Gammaproteobacteria bacterium]